MLRTYGVYWTIRKYVLGKRYAGWSKHLEAFLSERAGVIRESMRKGVCPFCGERHKPGHGVRKHMYAAHWFELKSLVDQLTLEYRKGVECRKKEDQRGNGPYSTA